MVRSRSSPVSKTQSSLRRFSPTSTSKILTLQYKPYGLVQAGYDTRYLASHFFKPKRRGKLKLWTVAGSTMLLYLLRDEIREEVLEHRSPGRTRFLDDVHTMGKGAFAPSLALVSYGASFITKDPREKETAFLLLESMAFSAACRPIGDMVSMSRLLTALSTR